MVGRLLLKILGLTLAILLPGCGIQEGLDRTHRDTEKMKAGMDTSIALQQDLAERTKTAFHKQTLSLALSGLYDFDNTTDLNPPTKMVPYGKAFAEEATADEIVNLSALYIADAKNREGGILTIHQRQVDLTGIGIVGGYTSIAKFNDILSTQIDQHGQYENYIYSFILCRYNFIRDFQFLPIIQKTQYLNKTSVLTARDAYLNLKQIAQLPYADRVRIEIPAIFYSQSLDISEASRLASDAQAKFRSELPSSVLQDPVVAAAMNELR